uniref:PB1 domain-containing protein n=1 Tax=Davidia involucrata TaxID=16924 RepID=A0A5B6YP07_DAVIN
MTRTLNSNNGANTIKFLYSYGGKLLPRRADGKLCYVSGYTRILAVDRSFTFAELMVKFGELCGSSMSLKCKLPSEDLDVLVSVTGDDDLVNVIEEYDRVSSSTGQDLKIRAILFPLKYLKKVSPPLSTVSSVDFSASKSPSYAVAGFCPRPPRAAATAAYRCGGRNYSLAVGVPVGVPKDGGKVRSYPCCGQGSHRHLYLFPSLAMTQ